MVIRNLQNPEVKATRYIAHGQGVAHFLLDTRHLRSIMFFAHAAIAPGGKLHGHRDPMEEIYYILQGKGFMQVEDEIQQVAPGDAIYIPPRDYHELTNTGEKEMAILVVAGSIQRGRL